MSTGTAYREGGPSERQREIHGGDGFFSLRALSDGEVAGCRERFETMERELGAPSPAIDLPRPLGDYIRVHSNVVMPMVAELALNPAVLDAVESVIGPDILIWGPSSSSGSLAPRRSS